MKLGKLLATLGTLAVAAVTLAACGKSSSSTSQAKDQTLNWSVSAELPTMDLSQATDTVSFTQLNNTMEGLLRAGKNNKLEPGIAKSYSVSKDGKTYTFNLRQGAKWSNGDEVTAQDFVYSWQRTVNPKTGSEYAYLFSAIKNATEIQNGKKAVSSLGVKAEGKYTLVVTLTKPVSYFPKLMAFPSFYPQNEKVVKKYGSKYGTASQYMVYDGPFVQTGWTGSNLSWSLKKNNDYWDSKNVKLSTINVSVNKSTTTSYNLYQSNKLDETGLSAEQAKQLKGQSGYTTEYGASTFYLVFNFKNKYLKNANIRKALSLVIDRNQFVSKVLSDGSTAAKGLVPSGLSSYKGSDFADAAYVSGAVAYNTTLAKKYWKQGLKELGVSKLTLNLLSDDTDTAKNSTDFLQSAMESNLSGLTVNVSNVPFKTRLSSSASGDFDIVFSAWGADYADPSTFLDLFTSSNSYNNGKWSNAQYDKLVAKAEGADANNEAARWNDFIQAEKVLMNDQAIAPVYYQNSSYMIRPTVKNLIYNSTGANWNFKETYISNN